jgi:hypothetical protein
MQLMNFTKPIKSCSTNTCKRPIKEYQHTKRPIMQYQYMKRPINGVQTLETTYFWSTDI